MVTFGHGRLCGAADREHAWRAEHRDRPCGDPAPEAQGKLRLRGIECLLDVHTANQTSVSREGSF